MHESFTDFGIIIKQVKFGEADKFVTLLSENHGLIETIAKGSRRLTSKKSPHIDNLNLIRFQALEGHSALILTQAETVESFSKIKEKLRDVRTCFYIMEILNNILAPGQSDPQLFHSLKNYLSALNTDTGSENREMAVKLQLYLIRHLGFPEPSDTSPEALVGYFEELMDKRLKTTKIKL